MANANAQDQPNAPAPERAAEALPDYLTSPDAVSTDEGVQWRFGKAPNYSNTRRVWAESKKANHDPGSLAEMVENLVKNWEVEASFKTRLQDWRTIDHENYTFSMNGERPQTAEHMLKVGTYNAIIQSNEYYCSRNSDFASSHKTFKRMMPTFAWEVIEVYSGPPQVSFKWRHWGVMKHDYVGFNEYGFHSVFGKNMSFEVLLTYSSKGEKVTAKAHGGPIELFGVTVAQVDDKVRLQTVDTYMDPLAMFRQIAPGGIVNKEPIDRKVDLTKALDPSFAHDAAMAEDPKADHTEDPIQAGLPAHGTTQAASGTEIPVAEISLLGACPFAFHQQVDTESETQQPDAAAVETANGNATVQNVNRVLEETSSLAEVPELPAERREPVSHVQAQEGAQAAEIEHEVMDLDTSAPKFEKDTVANSEDSRALSHGMETGIEERCPMMQHEAVQSVFSAPELDPGVLFPAIANAQDMETVADVHEPVKKRRVDVVQDTPEPIMLLQEVVSPIPEYVPETQESVSPDPGEAVAAPSWSEETRKTHGEMGNISTQESSELMNQE